MSLYLQKYEKRRDSGCLKCYGKGYIGVRVNSGNVIPCSCQGKKRPTNNVSKQNKKRGNNEN